MKKLTFHIITIFPDIFDSYLNESILKRAQTEDIVNIKIYNLRDFADDKHRIVDDTPYGGGPGMVLKIEPIYKCIEHIKLKIHPVKSGTAGAKQFNRVNKSKLKIILTSAKGEEYTHKKAEDLKQNTDVIIICGRYEGVDERVANHIADEEISIGDYVLTGGELPAMVIVDSVTRLIPGVLGNKDSLASESHSKEGAKDFPVYTKPAEFHGWEVPKILQNGNHAEIEKWREELKK